jgi:exodeoxyribonuclease VII small subunit
LAERKSNPKRTPARNLSFGEAVAEVEEILSGLEEETVDIDRLGDEVARAVELIQVCRQKLEKTDREVRDLVAGLQSAPADDGNGDT